MSPPLPEVSLLGYTIDFGSVKVQTLIKRFSEAAASTETACVLWEYKCLANSDNVQWWVKANHCVVDQHNGAFLSPEVLLPASPKQCQRAACIRAQLSGPEQWEGLFTSVHAQGVFIPLWDAVRSYNLAQYPQRSTSLLITSMCKLMNCICWMKDCSSAIVA